MASFSLYNRTSQNAKNFPQASEENRIELTFVDESGVSLLGFSDTSTTFGTIVGYLSKEFEYSSTGNYTNIFGVQPADSLFAKVIQDETQRNIANYGLLTKKMYTQGESPTLNLDFRVWAGDSEEQPSVYEKIMYDSNGNKIKHIFSHPVEVGNALINATLPRVGKQAILAQKFASQLPGIKQALATGVAALNPVGVLFGRTADQNAEATQNTDAAAIDSWKELYNIIATANLSDLVSRKPPTCNVKIGNIFEKDMMVIKQVDMKLSKEYQRPGVPLYGDFSIVLQSLFNAAAFNSSSSESQEKTFGSGLNNGTTSNPRITFDV